MSRVLAAWATLAGSGKTYTMTGNRQSFAERGLIPRFIAATLQQLAAAPGLASWRLGVSYLEVYNEALFDLLDLNTQPHELSLYEDGRGLTQVRVLGFRAHGVLKLQSLPAWVALAAHAGKL